MLVYICARQTRFSYVNVVVVCLIRNIYSSGVFCLFSLSNKSDFVMKERKKVFFFLLTNRDLSIDKHITIDTSGFLWFCYYHGH